MLRRTSSLKSWKATTIPFLSNGTKSIGYLLPLERETRLELATPTLARLCSTNWATLAMRAGDEARTRDLQLGRLSLYRLSYSRMECSGRYHSCGYYTYYPLCVPSWIRTMDLFVNSELLSHWAKKTIVGIPGFEPGTPWSQTKCATGLRYIPNLYHMSKNTTKIKKNPELSNVQGSNFWLF